MSTSTYTIRKSFLLPLGLIVLLALLLLISCILLKLPLAKTIILGAFILPALIIFLESSKRRVQVGETDIEINRLFRKKLLSYQDLTSIDTVQVRKRAFVSLSTEEDFVILSNSYAHFGALLQQLLAKVPESVVSEETKQLATNPPEKSGDVFSAWVAVAVLALILYVQLRGAF